MEYILVREILEFVEKNRRTDGRQMAFALTGSPTMISSITLVCVLKPGLYDPRGAHRHLSNRTHHRGPSKVVGPEKERPRDCQL